jgi:hypothetical protein
VIHEASWAGKAIAASSWEVPAMASLWTGLRPWQHQSVHVGQARLADDLLTLPQALKAAGYQTAGFTSGHWYTGGLGYDRGFDALQDFGRGREAMERLKTLADGRQFLWIHIPDARAPYLRRDWLVPRLGPGMAEYLAPLPRRVELADLEPFFDPAVPLPLGRRRWFFSMYRLNVAWADERFGRLLEALKASGHYAETLLVVTANHGEEFGEHDQILHGGNLGRSLLEVPLIVKLPAGWKRPIAEEPARHVAAARLWATLVEAAGGTPPPAVAPSLFHRDHAGVVSELYQTDGANQISLVDEEGYQLLWTSRYAPADPGYYGARLASLTRRNRADENEGNDGEAGEGKEPPDDDGPDPFASTHPFFGLAAPGLRLEQWGERGTTAVADPGRQARMARQLAGIWQRFLPGETRPGDEEREWSPAALEGWRRAWHAPSWRKGMAQR